MSYIDSIRSDIYNDYNLAEASDALMGTVVDIANAHSYYETVSQTLDIDSVYWRKTTDDEPTESLGLSFKSLAGEAIHKDEPGSLETKIGSAALTLLIDNYSSTVATITRDSVTGRNGARLSLQQIAELQADLERYSTLLYEEKE